MLYAPLGRGASAGTQRLLVAPGEALREEVVLPQVAPAHLEALLEDEPGLLDAPRLGLAHTHVEVADKQHLEAVLEASICSEVYFLRSGGEADLRE